MTSRAETTVTRSAPRRRTISFIAAACIGIAALYLIMLHWQHLASVIPVLLLLACPLMHLLHHRGHDHQH